MCLAHKMVDRLCLPEPGLLDGLLCLGGRFCSSFYLLLASPPNSRATDPSCSTLLKRDCSRKSRSLEITSPARHVLSDELISSGRNFQFAVECKLGGQTRACVCWNHAAQIYGYLFSKLLAEPNPEKRESCMKDRFRVRG